MSSKIFMHFCQLKVCLHLQHSRQVTPSLHEKPKLVWFLLSIWFCKALRLIFEMGIFLSLCPIWCNLCPIVSQRFQMKLCKIYGLKIFLCFLVHRFIESFIWNLWLMIGQELHKIGWRDRKIPISKSVREPGKIAWTAWQNWSDMTKIGSTTVCVNGGSGPQSYTIRGNF